MAGKSLMSRSFIVLFPPPLGETKTIIFPRLDDEGLLGDAR
jgi:hypothetical protein